MNDRNRWKFVITELTALQSGFEDPQPIAELHVERILLCGYNITKSKDQVYHA
jgi:hypothetical protein